MMKQVRISNEIAEAVISELGAEIKSLKKNGREIIWEGDPSVWEGQAPFLFPICGGLRDNRYILNNREYHLEKHGFASKMQFDIESQCENAVTFLLKDMPETLECFPNTFECRVTYRIIETGLAITYDVKNTDIKTMYFSMGAHEGYVCPEGIEEYSIVFEHNERLETALLDGGYLGHDTCVLAENARELPLKYEYFFNDNSLVFTQLRSRKVSLIHKSGEKCISVHFNGFECLLLWTVPEAGYICIEPWCGIPDYADSDYDITRKKGIMTLKSGERCVRQHTIIF